MNEPFQLECETWYRVRHFVPNFFITKIRNIKPNSQVTSDNFQVARI